MPVPYYLNHAAGDMFVMTVPDAERWGFEVWLHTYDQVNCLFLEAPGLFVAWTTLVDVTDCGVKLKMVINSTDFPVYLQHPLAANRFLNERQGDDCVRKLISNQTNFQYRSPATDDRGTTTPELEDSDCHSAT